MNLVLSGGLITVVIGALILSGFAKIYDLPKSIYWIILGGAMAVCAASQGLSQENPFRRAIREDVLAIFWWLKICFPIMLYAGGIYWIRNKVGHKNDSR